MFRNQTKQQIINWRREEEDSMLLHVSVFVSLSIIHSWRLIVVVLRPSDTWAPWKTDQIFISKSTFVLNFSGKQMA